MFNASYTTVHDRSVIQTTAKLALIIMDLN